MSYRYDPDWSDSTKFLSAAVTGDVEMIERMVANGVSVDTCDSYGEPALLMAARLKRPAVVKRLLRLGADVGLRARLSGSSLVHNLAAYPECVSLLPEAVRRGGDVNARDNRGKTPLMQALTRGCEQGARRLLKMGAEPLAIDLSGNTALHHFVGGIYGFRERESHRRQLRLMRDLLELGIDPDAVGEYGKTVATIAAEKGLSDVLALVEKLGGQTDLADETGLTPLQTAAISGKTDTAEALLASGASLDFFSAIAVGRLHEVQLYLEKNPRMAAARLEKQRWSALSLAIRHGNADIVRLLLSAGADPAAEDFWTSSLHNAVEHLPDPEIFTLLIEYGANIDAVDGDSNTPLNFAARKDTLGLARILLKAGADPNAPTERGYPPIQFATSERMRDLIRSFGGH